MKTYAKYGAGLIGLYLLVAHGTSSGRLFSSGARGGATLVRAFQGRR